MRCKECAQKGSQDLLGMYITGDHDEYAEVLLVATGSETDVAAMRTWLTELGLGYEPCETSGVFSNYFLPVPDYILETSVPGSLLEGDWKMSNWGSDSGEQDICLVDGSVALGYVVCPPVYEAEAFVSLYMQSGYLTRIFLSTAISRKFPDLSIVSVEQRGHRIIDTFEAGETVDRVEEPAVLTAPLHLDESYYVVDNMEQTLNRWDLSRCLTDLVEAASEAAEIKSLEALLGLPEATCKDLVAGNPVKEELYQELLDETELTGNDLFAYYAVTNQNTPIALLDTVGSINSYRNDVLREERDINPAWIKELEKLEGSLDSHARHIVASLQETWEQGQWTLLRTAVRLSKARKKA